ncbi:MAG: methyl-accepting chemotaxis sensory transducer [Thermoleophilia bacterium]|nr:methyl-accepting chemotaxis sensory transducer [Thermoleophilia bacterium]
MHLLSAPFRLTGTLLERVSFAWKFAIIAVVLLTPLVYVGKAYLGSQGGNHDFSDKERVGERYIEPATVVTAALAEAQSAAVKLAGGATGGQEAHVSAVAKARTALKALAVEDAKDGDELKTHEVFGKLQQQFDAVAERTFATPSEAYAAWTPVVDYSVAKVILQAGNISNLILDPNIDSYYLMDNHVIRIPTLMQQVGQAADLQQIIKLERLRGDALVDRRLDLSRMLGQIEFNQATLEANFPTSIAGTKDSTYYRGAATDAEWHRNIDAALEAYTDTYGGFNELTTDAVEGRFDALGASTAARATIAGLARLQTATTNELDALIVYRTDGYAAAQTRVLIVSGIALTIALLLFGGFYQSVRSAIRALLGASDSIGRGVLDERVDVTSRDELGSIATSFREMSASLQLKADAATRIAAGDVEVDIDVRGDRDALGLAFQSMVDYLQETARIAEQLAQGNVDIDTTPRSERDVLGHALRDTVTYLREMSATAGVQFADLAVHISEQARVADRIANGDLSIDVSPRSDADVLGHAFQRMNDNLRSMMQELTVNAESVSAASEELSATSREVTSDMEAATGKVAELEIGSADQLRILEQVNAGASGAHEANLLVVERSRGGREAMAAASSAMDALEQSSTEVSATMLGLEEHGQRIEAIIGTITAISDQTNLLALNAAIEAARAGDAGRGFAVVADEVRKLAEESQTAAQSVAGIVLAMQQETNRAVKLFEGTAREATESAALVQRARSAFEEIDAAVGDASRQVQTITTDAAEAGDVATNAGTSTRELGTFTSQTTASMEEVAASSEELARLAEQLTNTTSRFRLAAGRGGATATGASTNDDQALRVVA